MVKDNRFVIAYLLGLTMIAGGGGYAVGYLHSRIHHMEQDNERLQEILQVRQEILRVQKELLEMEKKQNRREE